MRAHTVAAAVAVTGLTAGVGAVGPDWVENGDAGDKLGSAQQPIGTSGNLNTIAGSLTGEGFVADFEDCYLIRIVNPALFSMTMTNANFNPQIFLFNISLPGGAFGLLANDDQASPASNLSKITNVSTDGTNVIVNLPGDYMIAVTGFNRDPSSQTGLIFNQASLTEVSGPDGPGGFNEHIGWTGTGQTGDYVLTLTGCGFPIFPAPGTAGVLMLAGLAGARRKR